MPLTFEGYKTDEQWKAEHQALNNSISAKYSDNGVGILDSGLSFLKSSPDSYVNAVNQETLWKREDLLRQAAELREDTSLDRIIEAGKRNGINPIFLLDALSGNPVGNAASYATSAAKANSYETNAKTDQATSAKIVGGLLAAIGIIIAHAL